MVSFMIRAALKMLGLAGLLYATFFVSLGEHTLYEHVGRIASTPEAQELTAALKGFLTNLVGAARQGFDAIAG